MSEKLQSAIARRCPAPEWATFFEVRNDAGFEARRSADAVAMNTWPSRGLAIHGFECKVSRSDWMRELRDPSKSAPIQKYCDRWWIVVDSDDVAKVDEVPETWGLLVLRGKSLVQVKEAPKLEPEALSRGFMAAVLRNAGNGLVPKSQVDELVQERLDRSIKSNRDSVMWQAERDAESLKDLRAKIASFETSSGIKLDDRYAWGDIADPTKLGAAVRAILSGDSRHTPGSLKQAKNLIDGVARDLQGAIDAVTALHPQAEGEAAE